MSFKENKPPEDGQLLLRAWSGVTSIPLTSREIEFATAIQFIELKECAMVIIERDKFVRLVNELNTENRRLRTLVAELKSCLLV